MVPGVPLTSVVWCGGGGRPGVCGLGVLCCATCVCHCVCVVCGVVCPAGRRGTVARRGAAAAAVVKLMLQCHVMLSHVVSLQ